MKVVKILLSIILLLVLIVALAAGALMLLVDPNKLKPLVAEEITQQTGYFAVIDGKVTWSLYPLLGIKFEHMTLQAPNQAAPFIDMHDMTLATELTQLIHGRQKLTGNVYIKEMQLLKMKIQNAHVGIDWTNNILTLSPITASLYSGKVEGSAHGQDFMETPKWDGRMQLANVEIKPLLTDLNGTNSKLKLSGTGNVNVTATAEGRNKDELLNSMVGNGNFMLTKGMIEGIDLNYYVQMADALISKRTFAEVANTQQTNFDSLSGGIVLKEGAIETNDVSLLSAAFAVKGAGIINLLNQSLNYRFQIVNTKLVQLKWMIPLTITGNISDPSIRLDTDAINEMIAREQLQKVKDKVQDEINKLPEQANQFLQNLLGH